MMPSVSPESAAARTLGVLEEKPSPGRHHHTTPTHTGKPLDLGCSSLQSIQQGTIGLGEIPSSHTLIRPFRCVPSGTLPG